MMSRNFRERQIATTAIMRHYSMDQRKQRHLKAYVRTVVCVWEKFLGHNNKNQDDFKIKQVQVVRRILSWRYEEAKK